MIRKYHNNKPQTSPIRPYYCSSLPNGDNQWHLNDQDKANCLNDYVGSISPVNAVDTRLPTLVKTVFYSNISTA